jgi:hypothetical protein
MLQLLENGGASIKRQRSPALRNRAKLVDPVAVVGVVVSDDDSIEIADTGIQKLRPNIGSAIHQEPLAAAFHKEGAARPPVLWLIGVAFPPVGADPGNSGGRPAAEDRQLQLSLALLKSL